MHLVPGKGLRREHGRSSFGRRTSLPKLSCLPLATPADRRPGDSLGGHTAHLWRRMPFLLLNMYAPMASLPVSRNAKVSDAPSPMALKIGPPRSPIILFVSPWPYSCCGKGQGVGCRRHIKQAHAGASAGGLRVGGRPRGVKGVAREGGSAGRAHTVEHDRCVQAAVAHNAVPKLKEVHLGGKGRRADERGLG